MNTNIKIITTEKNWMEHTAVTQLQNLANLPGVTRAVGLPDLHAGKSPVGIAIETEGIIYPHIIGNDIGCGMGLFSTNIPLQKYKADRWVTRLNHIRALEDIETVNPYDEESPIYDLGTIGGGNHFAEFQKVEEVYDSAALEKLGIFKDEILLLIHCGSRGYGQQILSQFLDFSGIKADSNSGKEYLAAHDNALLWAQRNRLLVAEKLVEHLGYSNKISTLLDCKHNFIEVYNNKFIHRKGAVSAQNGPVLVPGSCGSLTYLVKPSDDTSLALYSLSHGAGRKWARSLCKSRIREKYDRNSIRETKLKSKVVCHDTELLFQEAPEAYKNVEHIIMALQEHNLIEVIATFRPMLTFKG